MSVSLENMNRFKSEIKIEIEKFQNQKKQIVENFSKTDDTDCSLFKKAMQVSKSPTRAEYKQRKKAILDLLKAGTCPKQEDSHGLIPIAYAASLDHRKVVKYILEWLRDVEDFSMDEFTYEAGVALYHAALFGHQEIVYLVLNIARNMNKAKKLGMSQLHDIMEWAPLNNPTTPLELCLLLTHSENDCDEIAKILIDEGANLIAMNIKLGVMRQMTILMLASYFSSKDVLKSLQWRSKSVRGREILQDFSNDIHRKDTGEYTALHYAAARPGGIEVLKFLVTDFEATIDREHGSHCTPTFLSLATHQFEKTLFLLENRKSIDFVLWELSDLFANSIKLRDLEAFNILWYSGIKVKHKYNSSLIETGGNNAVGIIDFTIDAKWLDPLKLFAKHIRSGEFYDDYVLSDRQGILEYAASKKNMEAILILFQWGMDLNRFMDHKQEIEIQRLGRSDHKYNILDFVIHETEDSSIIEKMLDTGFAEASHIKHALAALGCTTPLENIYTLMTYLRKNREKFKNSKEEVSEKEIQEKLAFMVQMTRGDRPIKNSISEYSAHVPFLNKMYYALHESRYESTKQIQEVLELLDEFSDYTPKRSEILGLLSITSNRIFGYGNQEELEREFLPIFFDMISFERNGKRIRYRKEGTTSFQDVSAMIDLHCSVTEKLRISLALETEFRKNGRNRVLAKKTILSILTSGFIQDTKNIPVVLTNRHPGERLRINISLVACTKEDMSVISLQLEKLLSGIVDGKVELALQSDKPHRQAAASYEKERTAYLDSLRFIIPIFPLALRTLIESYCSSHRTFLTEPIYEQSSLHSSYFFLLNNQLLDEEYLITRSRDDKRAKAAAAAPEALAAPEAQKALKEKLEDTDHDEKGVELGLTQEKDQMKEKSEKQEKEEAELQQAPDAESEKSEDDVNKRAIVRKFR